ncbi:MAG: RES family NAD+ phosphorylase [Sphingomonas sp.]
MPITFVCHGCVTDPFLSAEMRAGARRTCSQCGRRRPGLMLETLADRIDAAMQDNFQPDQLDDGESYSEVIQREAGLGEELADAIQAHFVAANAWAAGVDGEPNIYEASFVETPLERTSQRRRWAQFKESVRGEARFFNPGAERWLAELFEGLHGYADYRGQPVIRTIAPGEADARFVRGRVAQDEADITRFLLDPAAELGPPPVGTASAGRMNAAGVSVFYGAFDIETCRAEIRPPVGAHAVFASFELIRPVRLLDFDLLRFAVVEGSIFDPEFDQRVERAGFLRRFGAEVSRPVLPRDEAFGYLPTQVVADYIAQRLDLDGMLFRSVQAGGNNRNLVLFHPAARVEPWSRPANLEVDVDFGWWDEDQEDGDENITIREHERPPAPVEAVPVEEAAPPDDDDFAWVEPPAPAVDPDARAVTLRFLPDSLAVHYIASLNYTPSERGPNTVRLQQIPEGEMPF